MKNQVRQGDVLFVPIDRIPEGARLEKGRKTVAYGEATGHHHDVVAQNTKSKAEIYSLEDALFLGVEGDVVVHQKKFGMYWTKEGGFAPNLTDTVEQLNSIVKIVLLQLQEVEHGAKIGRRFDEQTTCRIPKISSKMDRDCGMYGKN